MSIQFNNLVILSVVAYWEINEFMAYNITNS